MGEIDEAALPDDVRAFVPACKAFVADWKPRWVATEVVVFNRSVGYAGTYDAALEIPGLGLAIVDWKSRGSQHGAYSEEACQLGAYAGAEYQVVVDPETGEIHRTHVPAFDLGLIVSLTADDGFRAFPVDLEQAYKAFLAMHETWIIRGDGEAEARRAIGDPLTKNLFVERLEWVRERVRALPADAASDLARHWPENVPRKLRDVTTNTQLDQVVSALNYIEAEHKLPFPNGDDPAIPPRTAAGRRNRGNNTPQNRKA